jgi:hypothetical protein
MTQKKKNNRKIKITAKKVKRKPSLKSTNKKANPILSNGVSESEFLQVLDNISRRLAHKFRFGYHDFDDMKQQACIFAMEGLEKYDNTRPLENFLWTHVRNRLFNYKRNNYQRPDKPCLTCPLFDKAYKCSLNQCSKYTNKSDCELYATWSSRNDAKKNIMQPTHIEQDLHENKLHSNNFINVIQNQEIITFLDENISGEYRETYLKLKHGTKIPKQQLNKLQKYIFKLMENSKWTQLLHHEKEDN